MKAIRNGLAVIALTLSGLATGHTVSTAYVKLIDAPRSSQLQVEVPLRDLDDALNLDAEGSGRISWGLLAANESRIADWERAGILVSRSGRSCELRATPLAVDDHAGTPHAVVTFAVLCPTTGSYAIEYRLLFDRDRTHRALFTHATANGAGQSAVLSVDHQRWQESASGSARFVEFVRQGIWHIWLGYDHLAFLLLLLLPAVLRPVAGQWEPVRGHRQVALKVMRVVTAFTAAHSITLGLAASGLLTPPAAPIEAAIAVTVILAGLANLHPRLASHGAAIAFGFGLIHGFGFANALAELGLVRGEVVLPLIGFNVGVELGQLALVVAGLPLLIWAGRRAIYRTRLMPGLSAAVALLATVWLCQRLG